MLRGEIFDGLTDDPEVAGPDPGPPDPGSGAADGARREIRRHHHRLTRLTILITVLVLLLVGGGVVGGWLYVRSVGHPIEHAPDPTD